VRLAVGARPRDVRRQFLTVAVTLSTCGGVVGVVLGIGAAVLIARMLGWAILISPATVLLALTLAAGTGVVFGYYPAYRASRLDPVAGLRFE
jgi:ABC-type antimicrobial peptide transport system permease subunit